jgi:hypothetical protein
LDQLPDLVSASDHPDNMASLHALDMIAAISHPEAGRFLMERFEVSCNALLLDIWFRNAQEQIKRAQAQSVKGVVLDLLRACPGSRPFVAELTELDKALEDPAAAALPLVQRLMTSIQGIKEKRLVDCLADLAIGRSVRLGNLLPEAPEELRQRTQRLQGTLDACAEGLAKFVRDGILPKAEVLALFQKAYEGGAGGDGFGRSFAEILDDEDQAQRDLMLASFNYRWREEGITVLGEQRRAELLPFFLKAMADPIVDNAQLAIRYIGKLPGAYEAAMALFNSGKVDQIERALEIFSLNAMVDAGPVLLARLDQVEREDLKIHVIGCLGDLHYQPAIQPLIHLMRGGQSPRLQRAVAESLMAFDTPEAAQGLLQKALEVRSPEIQLLALDALARIRPDFHQGLTAEEGLLAEQVLEACFEEGATYRFRAILATQKLWTHDRSWLERLETRVGEVVAEQRKRPTWNRDQQQAVAAAMRELARKQRELGQLVASANRVRELIMAYAPGEARSAGILEALVSVMEVPSVFLGFEAKAELEALLASEFFRPDLDVASLPWLCRLVGKIPGTEFQDRLRDLHHRSGGQSFLHQACAAALLKQGYPEDRLTILSPSQDILIMDPSGFFRKRLTAFLQGRRVREATDRQDAEAQMWKDPADILISETSDVSGDLQTWFETIWRKRCIRQVILSTASRSLLNLEDLPWIAGILFKPYPMEDLLALLGG